MKNKPIFHRILSKLSLLSIIIPLGIIFISCSPDAPVATPVFDARSVLTRVASGFILETYEELDDRAALLDSSIIMFDQNPNEDNLSSAKQAWKSVRVPWEQSESFAFGPVITKGIDANLDDWPVNQHGLDAIIAGNDSLTKEYVDQLTTKEKGFHAMEYILFGEHNNKLAANMTLRERQMLAVLSASVKDLVHQLRMSWDPAGENFVLQYADAGLPESIYPTTSDAVRELLHSMIDVCDELIDSKIGEPLHRQDASYAESQFSDNTWEDYKYNLRGVRNAYFGSYRVNGEGISVVVQNYNRALDSKFRIRVDAAINAMERIPSPFSTAIYTQQPQLRFAQERINQVRETLEEITPLIQETVR